MRDAAVATTPTSQISRTNAKQLGDTLLLEAKRAECRAELSRGLHHHDLPEFSYRQRTDRR
jgi:hypothetical protein